MTTEIAVSNRLGIALATDSAVTITGGGRVKVFDTADKLFELSNIHPVGVMINGNMDCLGVPWEILAKNFREQEGLRERPKIDNWGRDFLTYIEAHSLISETLLGGYVENVTINEIVAVQMRVRQMLEHTVYQASDMKNHKLRRGEFDVRQVLAETIAERMKYLEGYSIADSLKELDAKDVREKYAEAIGKVLSERFTGYELTADEISGLTDLVVQSLLRSYPSDFGAGIVIAGFGSDETFPALFSAEVDGRVAGKLKIVDIKSNSIATSENGGEMIYFAQTDVIERLVKGVHPDFVGKTAEFIEQAVTQVGDALEKATRRKRTSQKRIAERERLIREVAETVADEYQNKTSETFKEGFSREFDRMVALMPKQELIELAEALVSITAVERKATSDEGTVGGPIDVAFITKHEGFVWIKRKHFFEASLNPRYFWRKYGNPNILGAS